MEWTCTPLFGRQCGNGGEGIEHLRWPMVAIRYAITLVGPGFFVWFNMTYQYSSELIDDSDTRVPVLYALIRIEQRRVIYYLLNSTLLT